MSDTRSFVVSGDIWQQSQQKATSITQTLNCFNPQKVLSDSNYFTWSADVESSLESLGYGKHLVLDDDEPRTDEIATSLNELTRGCITAWILRQLDESNKARFESKIKELGVNGNRATCSPAALWRVIEQYHSAYLDQTMLCLNDCFNEVESPSSCSAYHDDTVLCSQASSGPVTLLSLPNELLELIIESVYEMAPEEARKLATRKYPLNKSHWNGRKRFDTFFSKKRKPVLNSLQALAVVNRRVHQLCVPWLWNRLSLPHSWGQNHVPLDLWSNVIIPKYGSHIQSLKVVLSGKELQELSHPSHAREYSQSSPTYFNQGVTPQWVVFLLGSLPSLRHFELSIPRRDPKQKPNYRKALQLLSLGLASAALELKTLTNLGLIDSMLCCAAQDIAIPLITGSPLLESVSIVGFEETDYKEELIGYHLSQLKNLSRIRLMLQNYLGKTWSVHTWPQCLTELMILHVRWATPIELWKLINQIAPNLTKLTYQFNMEFSNHNQLMQPDWMNTHTFNLPSLIELDLKIMEEDRDMIIAFRGCKNIQKLLYRFGTGPCDGNFLFNMISNKVWPALNSVGFIEGDQPESLDERHSELRAYCNRVCIDWDFIRYNL